MEFTQNFNKAAWRHFRAAQILYEQAGPSDRPGCVAVAGYLFGIAGELAVKELMRNSGMTPLSEAHRRDDPFFAHFPLLKTLLATAAGRRAGELRQLSEDPACLKIGTSRCGTHQPPKSIGLGLRLGKALPRN